MMSFKSSHSIGNNTKMFDFKEKSIVSKDWLFVDKRKNKEDNAEVKCSCSYDNINNYNVLDEEVFTSNVLSKLRPFIPFSVEEASLTNNLENWTNCNVRLIGLLKYNCEKEEYFLESVNEPGGSFVVVLDLKNCASVPLLNECIQVFGEIKINSNLIGDDNCGKPFIKVSFFRNMESGNIVQYMEAVEKMRSFIPLYIKIRSNNSENNYDDEIFADYNII